MRVFLLGLGLIICVSILDVDRGYNHLWASDLPTAKTAAPQAAAPKSDIIEKAKKFAAQKDYSNVISTLSSEIESLNREGLFLLAKAYSMTKNSSSAIKAYTAALSLNPKDVEAKTLIGAEQFSSGKDDEAILTLKETLEINPRFVAAYRVLIRIYEKKKNKYELRLLYQDLVEKTSERPEYVTALCALTTEDSLYDLSYRYCNKGIQQNSKNPNNHVNLGITLKDTGKTDEAEKVLKKASTDFKDSEFAQITYAKFMEEKKNFIASYGLYKQASAINPKSNEALLGLAKSSMEIQKYADALSAFQTACKIDKTMMPAFRKATNTLRTSKIADWLKKFEEGVEGCGG